MKYIFRILFILFFFNTTPLKAQSMEVVSYYPLSAFVVNRLLPFSIGGAAGAFVQSVRLTSGDSCQSIVDPYHSKIFHIHCTSPSLVSAEIMADDGSGRKVELEVRFINIFREREPGSTVDHFFKSGGDE